MIRFDLSEFKDFHSFEMLIGDPEKPAQSASLIEPVKKDPFQLILFDELEKAHPNIWDLFLQLLDDGRLSPPGASAVSFRNTIIIATSNVGAQDASHSLGFGQQNSDKDRRHQAILSALENSFRPEFLNRFQFISIFHSLSASQVLTIARLD